MVICELTFISSMVKTPRTPRVRAIHRSSKNSRLNRPVKVPATSTAGFWKLASPTSFANHKRNHLEGAGLCELVILWLFHVGSKRTTAKVQSAKLCPWWAADDRGRPGG